MADYSLNPTDEEMPQEGLVLKKARAKVRSAGDTLTNNVTAGRPSVLPNSIEALRGRAADLYQQGNDLFNADPDTTALQNFAKQRGDQGDRAMLTALAAQFAGEQFQPVQEQLLKKAAAAREPMKLSGGIMTPEGQFIKDPFSAQDKRAEFLMQQARAYEQMAATAQTAQERARAEAAQNAIMNEIRMMNAQTMRMTAMGGPGGMGVGSAQQIGSGANNEPIFRQKNGQLFTYDQTGQPMAYSGQVLPRSTNASPTEDQSKAAAWFFQADNARRNMDKVMKLNPGAAFPSTAERVAGFIPGVGGDVANYLRPEDRQKFVQASGSMAEALLRAATGAGINKHEADQKVAELVPQLGDKQGVVKQKMDSYDVYMRALQTRAGRALNQPAAAGAPTAADNDPLGLRRPG